MLKLMGKETNAILGAQTIIIWTYVVEAQEHEVMSIYHLYSLKTKKAHDLIRLKQAPDFEAIDVI